MHSDHSHTWGPCAFGKYLVLSGFPFENERIGAKNPLKSPLAPQPVPQKLASMPPSKGPFSANIHPITPKLSVPIPEGMCFRKMVGVFPRIYIQSQTRLKLKSPLAPQPVPETRPFLPNMHLIKLCCAYSSGHVLSKKVWVPIRKCTGIGKNPHEITLSTPAGTPETSFNATF